MTFENMFLAGLAVGLGLSFSKFFYTVWSDWTDNFWKEWRKPAFIFVGILLFCFFVYLTICLSSRTLF